MPDITIKAADGGSFGAYLAKPASGKGPAVVVIQEIFGVNRWVRDVCDGLAKQGYIACAPDLFWRQKPGVQLSDKTQAEWDQAFGYMKGFDFQKGVGDLQSTISHARKIDGSTGKVGTVGFCLGGSLAYMTGCFTDSDGSVGYYPVQIENSLDKAAGAKKPVMLHLAEKDQFCPPDAQKKIKEVLGANRLFTIHTYLGADHAFARTGGQHYDKAAADTAGQRTLEFFKKTLG
jgi:carboxymethylenebutenolidase